MNAIEQSNIDVALEARHQRGLARNELDIDLIDKLKAEFKLDIVDRRLTAFIDELEREDWLQLLTDLLVPAAVAACAPKELRDRRDIDVAIVARGVIERLAARWALEQHNRIIAEANERRDDYEDAIN